MERRRESRARSVRPLRVGDGPTEQADDTPTGKLLEAIIESVDEFYSENLMPMVQSRQILPWGQPA